MWDRYLEITEAVKPEDDDAIWMSFEDFIVNFSKLIICKVFEWEEIRFKGKFIRISEENGAKNDITLSKFFYKMIVAQPSNIIIGMH
jgi:calpain-15